MRLPIKSTFFYFWPGNADPDTLVDAEVPAAERTARKQEEDARRSQQAQPKYSEPYPAKGRGKGSEGSKGSSTRPAQAEAASSYSSYGSYGRSQGYDRDCRGRWYWDWDYSAIVGLSTELPLLLIHPQTLPTFESRCTKALHCITAHNSANPNHWRLPPL